MQRRIGCYAVLAVSVLAVTAEADANGRHDLADGHLRIVQTAYDPHNPDLLKEMPTMKMESSPPSGRGALSVDSSVKFQEMLGFGGAFTEASAVNWRSLSTEDQEKIIHLYFADPSEGGHGYTVGRVPMGSCDFSLKSYSFDDHVGDESLEFFDTNVSHDEANGMLPMMRAAQKVAQSRGQELKIFASPWSPPPWMKLPVDGETHFHGSALPNGLDPRYLNSWAKYFSKFIDAYGQKGVKLWGVTPQNEPEFPAGWDACVYTPEFEAEFVVNHLGPMLHREHPGVKIIGFDHNKDHVVNWAKVLFKDNETKRFFDGIGVHWYGGLNTEHLQSTHEIAPDKFILATEACNCPGVVYQEDPTTWWSRAEKLAIDILEDIKWWSVGWVDWNLLVNTEGGPNWAGNLCDANIVADPKKTKGKDTFILQASYYFMGQFSRFIPPGSRRIALNNTVKVDNELTPAAVAGKFMQFTPCSGKKRSQLWKYDIVRETLSLKDVPEMCMQLAPDFNQGIIMLPCTKESPKVPAQTWSLISGVNGSSVVKSKASDVCMTSLKVPGQSIGLDPGVDAQGGLAMNCTDKLRDNLRDTQYQRFSLKGDYPHSFQIQDPAGSCMEPVGSDNVMFDAVAFETPKGDISIVAMNLQNATISFDIHDVRAQGSYRAIELPPHAIATYTWHPSVEEVVV